jgi:hypothetical protein
MARGKALVFAAGATFDRLTVLGPGAPAKHRMSRCRCACGVEKDVRNALLQAGVVRSCGCLRRESMARTQAAYRRTPDVVAKIKATNTAHQARKARLRTLEAGEQESSSGYCDKPARHLRPRKDAVLALAAAFGLTVGTTP